MSYVTIIWSGATAAALLLGAMSLTVWLLDRQARASLAFAVMAFSLAGIAVTELGMMTAQSAQDWGQWVRWCHVPMFMLNVAIVLFVKLYLGTGRAWLMWAYIATRGVILIGNFVTQPNFNFQRIDSVKNISFLGDQVTVLDQGVVGSWQILATLSVALMLVFAIDAAAQLWRQKNAEARRKAFVVGGSMVAFITLAVVSTQLVIWGAVTMPMLITPPFIFLLGAMAIEQGRDMLRAGSLARHLRESENRLALAAAAAQLGLGTWDRRHDRIWATERARALFGFGPHDEITLKHVGARIHIDDFAHVEETLRTAINNHSKYSLQFRTCPPNSPPTWIASQGEVEYDTKGRMHLVRGVLRDVSDQKKSEEEANELRRELAHAGRVTMLGQLASALAHELNQPLGAILRNAEAAEMLLAAPTPDLIELRAIVTDILQDDRRAGDIIDRLRSLLKRRQMQFQPLSVESLVKDTSTLLRTDAAAKHVSLEYSTEDALPMIAGDRVHLSQVLINLILNGMDAAIESNNARRISVAARANNGNVEIAVTDSGPGIATNLLARIFEPFFTTKTEGMGMGLAVSRTIVEAHGGQLSAENAIAGGAIFRLMLPAVAESVS